MQVLPALEVGERRPRLIRIAQAQIQQRPLHGERHRHHRRSQVQSSRVVAAFVQHSLLRFRVPNAEPATAKGSPHVVDRFQVGT